MQRVLIMGAAGRDFHTFNAVFRDDPAREVVAFTAAQIPGIEGRVYPPALAGLRYPAGIPVRPESELEQLIGTDAIDEVVFAYSDLSHVDVMHIASRVLAAGADFRLVGPQASMLHATKPVVAVCAVRTGSGKSQTSRRVGQILLGASLKVAVVRHPMPYGDLERMRVQRFASLEDIDASDPTIEEREEYEAPVRLGMIMYAGVDYAAILEQAQAEADVIVWDGGNNDFPFYEPDVHITVADPLRPGHEIAYHPGETNLRMADVVVINKVDVADIASVHEIRANIAATNADAIIIEAESPVTLGPGPSLDRVRVLVVEDGPSITHGGMPFGAGYTAARQAGATTFVDPRPYAIGSITDTYEKYPGIGAVLPAMGYGDEQIAELEATIRGVPCDVVVTGTPVDLTRILDAGHPVRRASYELHEVGAPTLEDVLRPYLQKWRQQPDQ